MRALKLDGLGVRVDSGFEEGDEISPYYDSLIAKLIAHADSRDEAIAALDAALAQAIVMGPKTNIAFLRRLIAAPEFLRRPARHRLHRRRSGAARRRRRSRPTPRAALAGAAGDSCRRRCRRRRRRRTAIPGRSPDSFDLMGPRRVPFEARVDGRVERFVAIARGPEVELAFRDGPAAPAPAIAPTVLAIEDGVLVMNGGRQTHVAPLGEAESAADGDGAGDGAVRAPMHGRLVALAVAEGETVAAGQRLAVLEAMKMEHALTAPRAGRVALARPRVGDTVEQGEVVMSVGE